MIVLPTVLGPDNVPIINDPADADADPPLTALSALVHHDSPHGAGILKVLDPALATLDVTSAVKLARHLEAGLGDTAAGHIWRLLMATKTFEYQTELERKGQAKGEAKLILKLLASRSVAVSEQVRERITACTDVTQLDTWFDRALTAESTDDLFK